MSAERDKMPRTDSTQAMKSIFSAYGEDEGVGGSSPPVPPDGLGLDDNISGSDDEGSSTRSGTPKLSSEKRIFESYQSAPLQFDQMFSKKPRMERKATRLVSYGPEEEDEEYHGDDTDWDVSHEEPTDDVHMDYTATEEQTEDDLLPPEPMGKCSKHLQEKISRLYQKALEGQDLKANIQNKKHFRNPSLYEKLIEFCGIDEKGTNYPPELYNPGIWSSNSHYDELARVQKIEMDKREKEKKDKTKIEFVTGTKKTISDGVTVVEQKRKSKWDTQPGSGSGSRPGSTGPVTTNPSGQKTTVISAVGTIKKHK